MKPVDEQNKKIHSFYNDIAVNKDSIGRCIPLNIETDCKKYAIDQNNESFLTMINDLQSNGYKFLSLCENLSPNSAIKGNSQITNFPCVEVS